LFLLVAFFKVGFCSSANSCNSIKLPLFKDSFDSSWP
jgi:hypothetical protein